MNVRRAILDCLASGQKSHEELLQLDCLDRQITRTLRRMTRRGLVEEHNGVYTLVGKLNTAQPVVEDVVEEFVVEPAPMEIVLEQLSEAFENDEIDREALLAVLDGPVKDIVLAMKTMSMEEIQILKAAEEAGKTRKSLMAAIEKLESEEPLVVTRMLGV